MNTPFFVQAFVSEFQIIDARSWHNLRKTLRLAAEQIQNVPDAWCGIRYKGQLVAELENNGRGELVEVNIQSHSRYTRTITVTAMNPAFVVKE